jgi:hypothetical protein
MKRCSFYAPKFMEIIVICFICIFHVFYTFLLNHEESDVRSVRVWPKDY